MKVNQSALGRLALLGAVLIWGTSFVILKNTLNSVSTLYVLAFRFTGATAIMALIGIKHLKELDLGYLKDGATLGVLLFLAYVFQTYGLVYTTAGKNAFLTATYCVMVPFLNWAFIKKHPDKFNVIAAILCIVGCGFVSLQNDFTVGIGDGLTMVCGLFYALHIIVLDKTSKNKSALLSSMIQFGVAAVLSWCFALITEPFPTAIPSGAIFSMVYLCVMCTAAAFFLQAIGQRYTPPTTVAIIMTLESVFGAAISAVVNHDPISPKLFMGFVLIFGAVIISETKLSFLNKKTSKSENCC